MDKRQVSELLADKQKLQDSIRSTINAFESKYPEFRIEKIEHFQRKEKGVSSTHHVSATITARNASSET